MSRSTTFNNLITLKQALEVAERNQFAIGSFSPRYTPMISAVLRGAQRSQSPAIVQISHKELVRYGITPKQFADELFDKMHEEKITVPIVLHLDHTKELGAIAEAIDAGFTSVMIDASEQPLQDNIRISKEVVEYAHARGVSVEAELGMIGTTDFVETDKDEELYTDPDEASIFVQQTGVDALAVSCGTAHGVYMVKQPKVDYSRLQAIRKLTPVHLVLHGGSGVPADMIMKAITLSGGGVSKVNIATDLELSLLQALEREERMSNAECMALGSEKMEKGREAVTRTVQDKIRHFLGSEGKASSFT